MAKTKGKTTDAVEILRRRFLEGNPEMAALVQQERDNVSVAQQLYDLRTGVGLTQQELAERVGTTASVISRLEDADYEGHSLTMLRRVAQALENRIEVSFIPIAKEAPRKAVAENSRQGRFKNDRQPSGRKAPVAAHRTSTKPTGGLTITADTEG